MSKKRVFTYRFEFKWDDGTEDETEFCASNIDEAMENFKKVIYFKSEDSNAFFSIALLYSKKGGKSRRVT